MPTLKITARILAAIVLSLGVTVLWFSVAFFFENELRSVGLPPVHAARAAALASLLVPALVPAIPLAVLFPQRAWLAALGTGWPPLAILTSHMGGYQGSVSKSLLMGFAIGQGVLYWLAFIAGAHLASRYWPPQRNLASRGSNSSS